MPVWWGQLRLLWGCVNTSFFPRFSILWQLCCPQSHPCECGRGEDRSLRDTRGMEQAGEGSGPRAESKQSLCQSFVEMEIVPRFFF